MRWVVALVLVLTACGEETSPCGPTSARVKSVVDGDTIVLESGEKIRYLLVDTPETTNGHDDCYGQEALAYNRSLVSGKEVTLKYDQECTDRYGRLLAYVSVGGAEVNTKLVEGGYACVLHIAPNGDDRVKEFESLRLKAQNKGAGMWGECSTISCQ